MRRRVATPRGIGGGLALDDALRSAPDHSFAICAYGQSPYLRECIESVLAQSFGDSEVFIATSTPSDWLSGLARAYDLPVWVNEGEHGIGQDWNFAYSCATGRYVTIAHQDDVYGQSYAREVVEAMSTARKPIIFFCDYGEIRNGAFVDSNELLRIKRLLLLPLRVRRWSSSERVRRMALSLGSSICCPSVTLAVQNCPSPPFRTAMQCNLDWDTWERFTRREGDFVYVPRVLMHHRIHEGSATTALIENNVRSDEDLEMFRRFWPAPVAKALHRMYARSAASNEL